MQGKVMVEYTIDPNVSNPSTDTTDFRIFSMAGHPFIMTKISTNLVDKEPTKYK